MLLSIRYSIEIGEEDYHKVSFFVTWLHFGLGGNALRIGVHNALRQYRSQEDEEELSIKFENWCT